MSKERTYGLPTASVYVLFIQRGYDPQQALERTRVFSVKFGNQTITDSSLLAVGEWLTQEQA